MRWFYPADKSTLATNRLCAFDTFRLGERRSPVVNPLLRASREGLAGRFLEEREVCGEAAGRHQLGELASLGPAKYSVRSGRSARPPLWSLRFATCPNRNLRLSPHSNPAAENSHHHPTAARQHGVPQRIQRRLA